jgi:conjugative relaxase-like TrwC/TraI family protein
MLRITLNKSAAAAKKYYSEEYYKEGNSIGNYYDEKEQQIGRWGGKAAEKLGLQNEISKSDFSDLCDNINPSTGEPLTQRTNAERRVGYDFTFNASKSVSLAYTFGNEAQKAEILNTFRDSVKETMTEIETGMMTRVRDNKRNENRETGNIAYGEFIHFTTRPIDGVPDPHLHAHCFVFNATFDEKENRFKAGQFGQIKTDASYYEAYFHSSFANSLQNLGYGIEKTANGFELKGISRETIEKFSNRTKEIEEIAEKQNITNDKVKSALGARTREDKRITLDDDKVNTTWLSRLSLEEEKALAELKSAPADEKKKESELELSKQAVNFSLKHHLERKSVSTDKEILATAIKSAIGQTTPEKIGMAFRADASIIQVKEKSQVFITTKEALLEETEIISKANELKGRFRPIHEQYEFKNTALTEEQQLAVKTALTNTDGVTIITGKAGTGKTTLMKEVQTGIQESGRQIFAFAPSAEASRMVQRKEGFGEAETVARLIKSQAVQETVKNSVIWIDEAGMLSNRDMNQLLGIAKEQNARLILTGDTKQHSSVERGDALRILEQEAGIMPVMVSKIQRQKNSLYKEAVSFLSKAETVKGFDKLEKIGAIHEMEDHELRMKSVAEDYYLSTYGRSGKADREVLVVSPTHTEGERLTSEIRTVLKDKAVISSKERTFTSFKNLQLTAAEKEKTENYHSGNWLIFHQNIKGIKAGTKLQITGTKNNEVLLQDNVGNQFVAPVSKSPAYNVYNAKELAISEGDKIRITGNGKSLEGVHLFNGTMYKVAGFDRQGNIKLSNGTTLDKDYGTFNLGYVLTSHASQGKTVDKVIISQSSISFRASSQEQFYVSVSRGRQAVAIYTDDKEDLLQAISKSGERRAAIELTKNNNPVIQQTVEINRLGFMARIREKALQTAKAMKTKLTKQNDIMNDYDKLCRKDRPKGTAKRR